ncbi:hypothetical protein [Limosilactobacillus caccae]|nr:hypothetical protein [Limosilactobacillus caccae]
MKKCPVCCNLSKNQKLVLIALVAGAMIWPLLLMCKLMKKTN